MVQKNTSFQSCLCVFNKNLQHTRTGSKCLFCVALGEAEGSRLKARTQKSRAKNFKGFFHISFQFKGEHPIHIQYIGLYHLCFQFKGEHPTHIQYIGLYHLCFQFKGLSPYTYPIYWMVY